jgi:hypothetical protein
MPIHGDIKPAKELGYKSKGRYIWVKCEQCSKEGWKFYTGKVSKTLCSSCSHKNQSKVFGEKCSNWKGGRYTIPSGYVIVRVYPDDFFYSMRNGRYVMEHRLIMAKHLGRCLQKWEVVHHKNGIRNDNRIENLELTTKFSHIKDHNKGYKDGYNQGYYDGKNKRISELEARITNLEAEIVLLKNGDDFQIDNKRIVKGVAR